jgi:hypothetical protein
MRNNNLFTVLALSSALLGACKWTDFDDLEDTTWVRSTENPDLGAKEYAVAIAGVSTGTSGGTLAVLSDNSPNFSILEYKKGGSVAVGANPVDLGTQRIGSISDAPVFATDPAGRIAIVERSTTGGNFAVVFGSATAPAAIEFPTTVNPTPSPDAAVFVTGSGGQYVVFAAGNSLNIVAPDSTQTSCSGTDSDMMPLQVAAMDHDGTDLWVWTKSGSLIRYPLAPTTGDVLCDTGGILTPPNLAFDTAIMPGPGARGLPSARPRPAVAPRAVRRPGRARTSASPGVEISA